MLKIVDNISTLGLINKQNGVQLFETIWENYYEGNIKNYIKEHILNSCIIDNDWKKIDKRLEPFIGVYPINTKNTPASWKQDFYNKTNSWLYCEFETYPSKEENACVRIKIKQQICSMLLYASDYKNEYIYDMNKKIKLLKYVKNKIKQCIEITDTELEAQDWYKYYIKKKETKKQLYLVITNSVASQIGMSSYAPVNSNGQKVWSSCQNIHLNYDGHARGIPSNLTDRGSLICYITDDTCVDFYNINNFKHQTMICRWMLRLLESDSDVAYVALDRAYPHDLHTKSVFDILFNLCKENNLNFSTYYSYVATQNEQHNIYKTADHSIDVHSSSAIMYSTICSDYDNVSCEDCRHHSTSAPQCCNKCNYFPVYCPIKGCADCYLRSSACIHFDDTNEQLYYSHYNDQVGGSEPHNMNVIDRLYRFSYILNDFSDDLQLVNIVNKYKIGDVVETTFNYSTSRDMIKKGEVGTIRAINKHMYGVDFNKDNNNLDDLYGVLKTQTGAWINESRLRLKDTKKIAESEAV